MSGNSNPHTYYNENDLKGMFRQYLKNTNMVTNPVALEAFVDDPVKSANAFNAFRKTVAYTDQDKTVTNPLTNQTTTIKAGQASRINQGTLSEGVRTELNNAPEIKQTITNELAKFVQDSGFNLKQAELKAVPGSLILRSRYDILPDGALQETPQQQVQDSSYSDFFSFVPPNGELGYKNSLFLQNRQHEKMKLYDSNTKPIDNVPNTLGFHSSLNDLQFIPVMADLREIEKSVLLRTPFKNLSGVAALPGSNMISEEPFSDEIRSSFLIPGEIQPGPFTRDNFSQPLAADFNNYIGMKPYYDQMRYPYNPSFQPTAQRSEADMLIQAYTLGPQIY